MRAILILPFLFFFCCQQLESQEPFRIIPENGMRLPVVFPLGQNYFEFKSDEQIVSAKILADTSTWSIEMRGSDIYIITSNANSRSTLTPMDTMITVLLLLKNGELLNLIAPVRVYAPVKIEPRYYENSNDDKETLLCNEDVSFFISWDYPSYVKMHWRVYGVFDMSIYDGKNRLHGFTGWYDAGDQTQMQKIQCVGSKSNLIVKVDRIKTLHRFTVDGKEQPLRLSENFVNEWQVNGE